MPTQVIPDEVWAGLDVRAGGLSRRDRRRVVVAAAVLLVVVTLVSIGAVTGLLVPRIAATAPTGTEVTAHQDIRVRLRLTNDAAVAAHITGIKIDDPAYAVAADHSLPLDLDGHRSTTISMVVHVRDCSAIGSDAAVPFAVTTGHWWGDYSQSISVVGVIWAAADDMCH